MTERIAGTRIGEREIVRARLNRVGVIGAEHLLERAGQLAAELEREGVTVTAFPMTDVRTIPASARLHLANR